MSRAFSSFTSIKCIFFYCFGYLMLSLRRNQKNKKNLSNIVSFSNFFLHRTLKGKFWVVFSPILRVLFFQLISKKPE